LALQRYETPMIMASLRAGKLKFGDFMVRTQRLALSQETNK